MINHARTLLLNRSRADLSGLWEEYVNPNFSERSLPPYLKSAWKILFGSKPDKELLNWRASQYMQILHSTEFSKYLTLFDSRISYKLPVVISDSEIPYAVVISANDDETPPVTLLGTPRDDPSNGRLTQSFSVVSLGNEFTVQNNFSGQVAVGTAGANNAIPLGQSGMSLLIGFSAGGEETTVRWVPRDEWDTLTPTQLALLESGIGVGDNNWLIESVTIPSRSLVDIVNDLKRLPVGDLEQIFGPSRFEPFKTFRELWYNDRGFPYKLSGLLLAWIYRQDKLTNG